jgi:hypothetical protein
MPPSAPFHEARGKREKILVVFLTSMMDNHLNARALIEPLAGGLGFFRDFARSRGAPFVVHKLATGEVRSGAIHSG